MPHGTPTTLGLPRMRSFGPETLSLLTPRTHSERRTVDKVHTFRGNKFPRVWTIRSAACIFRKPPLGNPRLVFGSGRAAGEPARGSEVGFDVRGPFAHTLARFVGLGLVSADVGFEPSTSAHSRLKWPGKREMLGVFGSDGGLVQGPGHD